MKAIFKIILASIIIVWVTGCENNSDDVVEPEDECADLYLFVAYSSEDSLEIQGSIPYHSIVLYNTSTNDSIIIENKSHNQYEFSIFYIDPLYQISTVWEVPQGFDQLIVDYEGSSGLRIGNEKITAMPADNQNRISYPLEHPLNDCYPYTIVFNFRKELDTITNEFVYIYDTYLDDDYEGLKLD